MPVQEQQIEPSAGSQSASKCQLICVSPERARAMWPHARHWIAQAVENRGDMTLESIEADLLSGLALLWIVWCDEVVGAATTSIVQTPRNKVCLFTAGGGSELDSCMEFLPVIEAYARAEQCNVIRVMGRRGWQKKLPEYHQPWIVLDKRIG